MSLERLQSYIDGRMPFGPFTMEYSDVDDHPSYAAAYLNALTESEEILLHGTGSAAVKTVGLYPQPAFDASSSFGNSNAVYATTSGTEALFRAMYNKPFARYIAAIAGDIEIAGFTQISQKKYEEVYEFRFMPFIFDLLQADLPNLNLLRDGFVYALRRDESFERHPERPKEWRTDRPVKPIARFTIKHQQLGDHYLRNKVPLYYSRPYADEEIERFRSSVTRHGRVPRPGSSEFGFVRYVPSLQFIRWLRSRRSVYQEATPNTAASPASI